MERTSSRSARLFETQFRWVVTLSYPSPLATFNTNVNEIQLLKALHNNILVICKTSTKEKIKQPSSAINTPNPILITCTYTTSLPILIKSQHMAQTRISECQNLKNQMLYITYLFTIKITIHS